MTDTEWLKMMAEREDEAMPACGGPLAGGFIHDLEHPYPREEAQAKEWGLHPHEARPRSGFTFLHERLASLQQAERLREHIQKLNAALAEDWPKEGRECPNCRQVWDETKTGEYPCSVCGMPRTSEK